LAPASRTAAAANPKNTCPPELAAEASRLVYDNARLRAELASLQRLYHKCVDPCFVHADIWAGNLLINGSSGTMYCIDFEFGQLGPQAYDVGHGLTTCMLNAVVVHALAGLEAAGSGCCGEAVAGISSEALAAARQSQLAWMVPGAATLWAEHVATRRAAAGARWSAEREAQLLADAIGYAGIAMLRSSIGQYTLWHGHGMPMGEVRVAAVRRAMYLGSALLRRRRSLRSMAAAQQLLEAALAWDGRSCCAPTALDA
jgi:5-methylthioribose kinase